jgi:hypothetical protein
MSTIYVVYKENGEFDDYTTQNIKAFVLEKDAKDFCDKVNAQISEYESAPQPPLPIIPEPGPSFKFWFQDPVVKAEYQEKYREYSEKVENLRRSIVTIDDEADDGDRYVYMTLELV